MSGLSQSGSELMTRSGKNIPNPILRNGVIRHETWPTTASEHGHLKVSKVYTYDEIIEDWLLESGE